MPQLFLRPKITVVLLSQPFEDSSRSLADLNFRRHDGNERILIRDEEPKSYDKVFL